jgi:hypothetical protein
MGCDLVIGHSLQGPDQPGMIRIRAAVRRARLEELLAQRRIR